MRNNLTVAPLVAGLLAAGAVVAAPAPAAAQEAGTTTPACSSLTNPVYISGSSASKPVLQALATTLAADGVPISIVYTSPDSCLGVNDLLMGQPSTESGVSPLYLEAGGATETCSVAASQAVDIAVSDVFPATCVANAGLTIPSSVAEVQGPIQAMTMVVPGGTSGSSASSISAKAAYVVFGNDATTPAYQVAPWSLSSNIFVRAQTSGTLNMIAAAIDLIPSKWVNAATSATPPAQQAGSTGTMESDVATVTTNQSATIGILSAEGAAGWNASASHSSDPLKILAFQANDQSCGYLPDSGPTALDKINVRQGRYAIWGPLHFLAKTSGGQPTGPDAAAVATVLNYFLATGSNPTATPYTGSIAGDAGTGVSSADIQALITAETKPGYVVPWCAMQAQRSTEVGPESSYSPPTPCSCLYETTLGTPVSGHVCTPCGGDAGACSSGMSCNYGFCEVQ
jgi:ABC-type phosphate transport system substrate-binding protein